MPSTLFAGGFASNTSIRRTAIALIALVALFSVLQLANAPYGPPPPWKHPRPGSFSAGDAELAEKYSRLSDHIDSLQAELSIVGPQPSTGIPNLLSDQEASELCFERGLRLFKGREKRKVYDLFLAGTELDMLEIRLHELDPVVDYFVIVEASETFTNHRKPLYFRENFHRFQKFAPKIIYRVIDFSQFKDDDSAWDRESYQRNAMFTQVFPGLLGEQTPVFGDVILVSDLDEIPKPSTITALRNCEFAERTTIWSNFYYYSFQYQHSGDGDWEHPQVTFYQGLEHTVLPQDLRRGEITMHLKNASWHCSSCFSTVGEMVKKIESFSHTEFNSPNFKDPSQVVRRVRNGLDLFDREDQTYDRVENNQDIPAYLKEHVDVYPWLTNRDPSNANFIDYDAGAGEQETSLREEMDRKAHEASENKQG